MEENIDRSIVKDGDLSLKKSARVGGPVTCVAFSPLEPSHKNDTKAQSFCYVAQGPYLTRYKEGTIKKLGETDAYGVPEIGDSLENNDQVNGQQQLLAFPEDENRLRGGGTIHGIDFIAKEEKFCSSLDTVVYGGKRLAFCNLLGARIGRRDVIQSLEENSTTESGLSRSPFLELDDWIWNVKTFSGGTQDAKSGKRKMIMIVGFARHTIEVWNLEETNIGRDSVIRVNKLRRLFLDPPTVVTSMDFMVLNEKCSFNSSTNSDFNENSSLWIAAGTSFHQIWISTVPIKNLICDPLTSSDKNVDTSNVTPRDHHLLRGHKGVVHSVRWFDDGGKISLVSTSDDRSVRKWIWNESEGNWIEKWVGWGHSARVWNISPVYATSISNSSSAPSQPLLVSVAEDGTARVWSSELGESLACIHHSTTLWTVDTWNTDDGGKFIIGGVDGIAATYNVCNHVLGKTALNIDCIPIPDDRPPPTTNQPSKSTADYASLDAESSENTDAVQTKKKKKVKKKIQSQVIVGIKCWRDGLSCSKIVVATRQGSLMYFDILQRKWEVCNDWCEPSIEQRFGIKAIDGNCMAVCDGVPAVAIGTARGDVIFKSIKEGKEGHATVLNGRKLRSVQGLTFLTPSCLASFHVHSVALWKIDLENIPYTTEMTPFIILNVETKGIPQCCAFDQEDQRFLVGDSRGNIAYFGTQNSGDEEENCKKPTCIVSRVHQKQHVTSIKWLGQNTFLSAGNDGCLHVSYLHGNLIQKGWGYPAPSLTGITNIVTSETSNGAGSKSGPTIVAGYHGNMYRVMDMDSGYEYIRFDTGGRQRILDCRLNLDDSGITGTPLEYELVVCRAQKDGSNELFIQHSLTQSMDEVSNQSNEVSKGVKLHGETIFDSAFFTLSNRDVVYLVTVSEDCTSRISAWKGGRIVDSVKLTPQESCCRCVTVSQIDNKTALLVIGGGKLALQFFLAKERHNYVRTESTRDLEIIFIGNGLTSKKGATIDHRLNAVSAIPLLDADNRSHLVMAGDSEGCPHAFIICEADNQSYKNPRGLLVPTLSERPILCIDTLIIGERILILVGTTGGGVDMFDLPGCFHQLQNCSENLSNLWNPIGRYDGHQMGTNTISAQVSSLEVTNNKMHVLVSIVSGGDDQALCISRVALNTSSKVNSGLVLSQDPDLRIIPEASFSAIKGVSHVNVHGQRYILSVGYSQQLSVWRFDKDDDSMLQCTSRLPVDLGDVNCLSTYQSPDESTCLVAVCGMGVEVFQKGL